MGLSGDQCERCIGNGFYLDAACQTAECAHAPRKRSDRELAERREFGRDTAPISPRSMDCPTRPCSCPAGNEVRAELARKIEAQTLRLRSLGAE